MTLRVACVMLLSALSGAVDGHCWCLKAVRSTKVVKVVFCFCEYVLYKLFILLYIRINISC